MENKRKSITEIKAEFSNADVNAVKQVIEKYAEDDREGVKKLILSVKKRIAAYQKELDRMEHMFEYERLYLNDSKQLSEKKREELYDEIIEKAVAYGIGMADEKLIDQINILNADYEAMRIAIRKLTVQPDLLLNDAVKIPEVEIPQVSIIKGDAKSASIAAASIIAKVTRDRLMVSYDEIYPGYGFAKNKGYGSKEHIEALKLLGPCEIHRRSFITHFWKE